MATFDYDSDQIPPAPVCQIFIGFPGRTPTVGPLSALIDTGADASVIPADLVQELGLRPISQATARSLWGAKRTVLVYSISLSVADLTIRALPALAGDDDELVLGRTVLNRLHLSLDGPSSITEILQGRSV